MTDMPATPRWTLPMLAIAQAQKEMTHNEALTLLDALIHPAVEAGPLNDPPESPIEGQCWIIGPAATGTWAGASGSLAIWSAGGWRFVPPRPGMRVTRLSDGAEVCFRDGLWCEPIVLAAPNGGSTIDLEARTVLAALLAGLAAHGLIKAG